MVFLSYLMGGEDITDAELEALGIEIMGRMESGNRMLKVSESALQQYVDILKEKLIKGFWNEIIGEKEILFIFRFEDGHIEEYVLSPENEQQIDTLCASFNDEPPEKTANVYKYISENSFYHDFMHEHYAELVNR